MTTASLIDRFHGVLVESIRDTTPSYLRESFTVAEIYQSLVPYRTHRDRLGIEINGDYEDALLRMLAGEGEYLVLESEPARNRIRRELEHKNPNTGIYREFAAVEVRLNPDRIPEASGGANGRSETQTSLGGLDAPARKPTGGVSPKAPPGRKEVAASPPSSDRIEPSGASTPGGSSPSAPSTCPACGTGLPDRETLRFCPRCGSNVLEVPCRSCGEVLQRDWDYCVACGTPARG